MPRRQIRYVEKPWKRDPAILKRWQALLDKGKGVVKRDAREPKPKDGWQLWDWNNLTDVNFDEWKP